MNHLGDTNKMVRDTPRTDSLLTEILDAYGYVHQGNCPQRWVNHARELERELTAAHVEIERLTNKVAQLYEGGEEQKQRIKLLEDALVSMGKYWNRDTKVQVMEAKL